MKPQNPSKRSYLESHILLTESGMQEKIYLLFLVYCLPPPLCAVKFWYQK